MLQKHKNGTNIGVLVGLALQIGAGYVASPASVLLYVAGWAVFIWGCTEYARGKGHSPWFGLLGLLSFIGLIVLVFMPDRHKDVAPAA